MRKERIGNWEYIQSTDLEIRHHGIFVKAIDSQPIIELFNAYCNLKDKMEAVIKASKVIR